MTSPVSPETGCASSAPGAESDLGYARGRGRWNKWDIGAFHVKLHAPADAASRQEVAPCSSAGRTFLTQLAGLRGAVHLGGRRGVGLRRRS